MSGEWIQVRMRRATYARLRAFGDRVDKLVAAGRLTVDAPGEHLSADLLVAMLLDRDAAAQERNRRRKRGKCKCDSTT